MRHSTGSTFVRPAHAVRRFRPEATDARRGMATARVAGAIGILVLVIAAGGTMYLALKSAKTPNPSQGERSNSPDLGPSTANGATAAADTSSNGTTSAQVVDTLLNSANTYMRQGDFVKSEAVLKAAIAEHPAEQSLVRLYAELLAGTNRPAEAYDQYLKALTIGPRSAAIEFDAGTAASMAGKLDRASEHYSAAQAADPTDWRAPLYLAQVQIKRDEIENAKANLLIAGRLKPDLGVIWGTLADIALREGKASLALQHVAKARDLEPRYTLWRVIEARALKREGKAEAALQSLIGLDQREQFDPPVLQLMGECYGVLGRPLDAAKLYRAASDAKGEDGPLALETALWLERAGDPAAGVQYADRAALLAVPGAQAVRDRLAAGTSR